MTDLNDVDSDIDAEDDVDEGHLDGLRRIGLPVADRRQNLDDRVGRVVPLPTEALSLEDASVAESTRAKYRIGWIDFCAWCDVHGIGHYDADPADVRRWLEQLRADNLAVSTVQGRLAAVSWWYERSGRASPAKHPSIAKAMRGYARLRGTAQRRARPLMLDDLRKIVTTIPAVFGKPQQHPRVLRDRCLLTLGWAAGRRSAELVALDVEDLAFHGDPDIGEQVDLEPGRHDPDDDLVRGGVLVHIERSKSDQQAAGFVVGVTYSRHCNSCPARIAMLQARRRQKGPLFVGIDRHGNETGRRLHRNTVTDLVKLYVEAVLLDDPSLYSSHSLKSGLITQASEHGVPDRQIIRTTGHADTRMLTRYDRPREMFANNALQGEWW